MQICRGLLTATNTSGRPASAQCDRGVCARVRAGVAVRTHAADEFPGRPDGRDDFSRLAEFSVQCSVIVDAVNQPVIKENKWQKVHVLPNVEHIAGKAESVTMRSELSKHKTRQPLY